MHSALLRSAVLSSSLVLGGVVGCATDAPNNSPATAQPASRQEVRKMERDGKQLQQQGDEIGGQRLIDQGKLKAAGADATTKPAQP